MVTAIIVMACRWDNIMHKTQMSYLHSWVQGLD